MAMFHTRMSVVSRARGETSVAGAAYNSRSAMADELTGASYDFRRAHLHEKLVADLGVTLPAGADPSLSERSRLWNEVERVERGKKAQTARRIECSLPRELSEAEQVDLARRIVGMLVGQGMAVDACIHDALDGHNPHLHMQMPLRGIGPEGLLPKSVNVYSVRDASGHEARMTAEELGDALSSGDTWEKLYRYRMGRETRALTPSEAESWSGCRRVSKTPVQETRYLHDWNERARAREWRRAIAAMENEALAAHGSGERVDPRSYAEQGSDAVPGVHLGPAATHMVGASDRRRSNEAVARANAALRELARKMQAVMRALSAMREARRALSSRRRASGTGRKAQQARARQVRSAGRTSRQMQR